jgi:hypothetical protein
VIPRSLLLGLLASAAGPVLADAPEVVGVVATREAADAWRFDVSVRHADAGWEHYADGWEVLGPDGTRLGYRELLHPHDTEQPFTRSLSGVPVPAGVRQVTVRAHDSVHGWGEAVPFDLPE